MSHRPVFFLSVCAALAAGFAPLQPAAAQAGARTLIGKADFIPAEDIAYYRDYVVRYHGQGTTVHTAADEQTNYVIVVRTEASAVERHARWDDLVIARAGGGTVHLGRGHTGMRQLAPGEQRGGRLVGPTTVHLRPGDVARIPAGVPHAFVPDSGRTFEFLLIKIRRPNKPLR